jgi:excisionase family DNA binding protein
MSEIPNYLTLYEVAELLGRSHSAVRRYLRKGLLPCKHVGRQMLVFRSALRGFTPPPPGNPKVIAKAQRFKSQLPTRPRAAPPPAEEAGASQSPLPGPARLS